MVSKRDNTKCKDCGKETCLHHYGQPPSRDYYVVKHKLWETHGVGRGMLCLDCLETRMGRKLDVNDFIDCPVNLEWNPYVSDLKKQQWTKLKTYT